MKIFRRPNFERLSLVPVRGRRRRTALTAGLAVVPIAFAFSVYAQNKQSSTAIEPTAGEWRTWVISSGKDYRVPPPPATSDTRAELRNLAELISHNDEQTAAQISYWDAGGPQYRWIDYISNRLLAGTATTAFPHRVYTYVALAMYDATIATWESKYYYRRSRPSELDRKLPTAVDVPDSPSYPSEHAAAAQAAASVLAYFLPSEAANIQALADQAGWSRVFAGVQFPSDYYAGADLGKKVAERVIAQAKADGSDAVWTGSVPTGPCYWKGTNPGNVTAAGWTPLLLSRPDQFRPPVPPACDSAQVQAETAIVRNTPRGPTAFATNYKAFYWQSPEGLIVPLFPVPPFPSYPSNHSTFSSARGEVLAYLFPTRADYVRAIAKEGGDSRIWAGIHYPMDNEAGVALGKSVAGVFIDWAKHDGSQ